uniref:Disease resistance protein RGA3 n=1 Tax=Ananas comosus var. bracteatus TaxID=296719 RepID=A0A6V7PEI1_ANACO|nr:unnamed protein product [Ananas comosus var. bracteatus]
MPKPIPAPPPLAASSASPSSLADPTDDPSSFILVLVLGNTISARVITCGPSDGYAAWRHIPTGGSRLRRDRPHLPSRPLLRRRHVRTIGDVVLGPGDSIAVFDSTPLRHSRGTESSPQGASWSIVCHRSKGTVRSYDSPGSIGDRALFLGTGNTVAVHAPDFRCPSEETASTSPTYIAGCDGGGDRIRFGEGGAGQAGLCSRDEIDLLRSFKDDVQDLKSNFSAIQSVLLDAEERSSAGKESHALRDWLRKLKDAAYDADDLLDEIRTEAEKVRGFLSRANPMHLKFKVKMAHRMKELREKIGKIAKQRHDFGLAEAGPGRQAEFKHRETFSVVDEKEIVGRDDDKEKIVKLLLETAGDHDVSVIPIVGLGGLGKTTLAQMAFNDGRVTGQQRFDLRVWACVSTDFHMKTIARSVKSATKEECDLDSLESVASFLLRIFSQKRFLLVLDDVWNEDKGKWKELKVVFKDGRQGSKILVTTRSEKVAAIMKTVEPHRVKGLSDDDCWTLFKRLAFDDGKRTTIRVWTEDAWSAIRDSEIWRLEREGTILPSLKLSYIQMPSALKQCFAYCSIFPKDYEIDKDDLIRQWIALGFISSHEHGLRWKILEMNLSSLNSLVTLPESIGSLQNLRILDLSWCSSLLSLPSSSSDLQHLEALDISDCGKLCELPKMIQKLTKLRVLLNEDCSELKGMPRRIGKLVSLTELSVFVVGKQDRIEHCASISELEHLKLVGKLEIKGLENVTSPVDAKAANLIEKKLQSLKLEWNVLSAEEGMDTVLLAEEIDTVLENLQPHQKLESLTIEGYGGGKFPGWMMNRIGSCLPNLVEIKLADIPGCSSLPPLGQLPFLKELIIENMPAITNFGVEFYGDSHITASANKFPALTSLNLSSMPMLREWVTVLTVDDEECRRERVPIFPCLTHLILNECPQFSPEPCLPASVEELIISGTSKENLSLILSRAMPLDGGDAAVSPQPPRNKGLRNLIIDECQQLTCLPESLRSLTSLQNLRICGCEDLERIEDWLGELTELQSLFICLPSLRYLPAHKMTALQGLYIADCPLLFDADRRFVDTSVDHIKNVDVHGR